MCCAARCISGDFCPCRAASLHACLAFPTPLPPCPCPCTDTYRHLRDLRAAMGERIRASRRAGVSPDERRAARAEGAALSATRFACADFVESEVAPGSVDTITCLRQARCAVLRCTALRALTPAPPGFGVVRLAAGMLLLVYAACAMERRPPWRGPPFNPAPSHHRSLSTAAKCYVRTPLVPPLRRHTHIIAPPVPTPLPRRPPAPPAASPSGCT